MIVTRLRLANLRALAASEFRFREGFNLVVGVNGVGKTSILDALSVCLSAIVKDTNRLRTPLKSFTDEDIRIGASVLDVECGVLFGGKEHSYLVHRPREKTAVQEQKAGMPREQVHETPSKSEFLGDAPNAVTGKEPGGRPLAILFSTNRAVPSDRAPRKSAAVGGIATAYADAFGNRELRLGEYGDWLRVQVALRAERPVAGRALGAIDEAVARFLPGYRNLHLGGEDGRTLLIDHEGTSVPVRLLSDGERGAIALVLDLSRRLAQANPQMADPAAEAEAIVLIDEIDLHLHPTWQRQIVRNLVATFPKCQFIATTHSPQVIGEVEHGRIQIIADGQVYSPTHSFGVDSSRVLEEIMNADPRTREVQELLSEISEEVGAQRFEKARELVAKLSGQLGENDPEVTRTSTLIDFMEGKE
jgi:predicted ATP-binding protein involved in virulence